MTCFQQGILKLQPESSRVNATLIQTVKVLKRFTISSSEKVRFLHSAHNGDRCSSSSTVDTSSHGGITERKCLTTNYLHFITLEIKSAQFSVLLEEVFALTPAIARTQLATMLCARQKVRDSSKKYQLKKYQHCCIPSLSETAYTSAFQIAKGFDYSLTKCCLWSWWAVLQCHDFLCPPAVRLYMWILWQKKSQRVFEELWKTDPKGN